MRVLDVQEVPCPRCGQALRSEVRNVGAFYFVAYFDAAGDKVERCPNCGYRPNPNAFDPTGLAHRE